MLNKQINPKLYYGYIIVAAGFVVWMVSAGISNSFGVFLKPLIAEFSWSRAETVLAVSLSFVIQALMSITLGWLTDRLGPRLVVAGFGAFVGISLLLMSHINSLWQYYLYYALAAVGFSISSTPIMSTVARWFMKRRALMTGIVQAGLGIGGFIIAPFMGWLIINYGWRSSFTVLGIIALISVISAGAFMKRAPEDTRHLPDKAIKTVTATGEKHIPGFQPAGFSLRQALIASQFWVMIGIFFSFGYCRSTFLPHIPAHVQDLGFPLTDGANIVAMMIMSSILGRLWTGWFHNKSAFMISFGVTTFALVWGLMAANLWGLYLFAVAFGFGWGAQAVLRFTATAETFGLASVGLIMGVFGFAEAAASAFGSYLGGYVYDAFGNYQIVFYLGIALSVAGIILAWQLKPIILKDSKNRH